MRNIRPAPMLALIAGLLGSVAVYASPCGTELCLSDLEMSMNGKDCKNETSDFFSIVKYRHGKPDIPRTIKARKDFLDKCPSGNTKDKADIMARFGGVVKSPY